MYEVLFFWFSASFQQLKNLVKKIHLNNETYLLSSVCAESEQLMLNAGESDSLFCYKNSQFYISSMKLDLRKKEKKKRIFICLHIFSFCLWYFRSYTVLNKYVIIRFKGAGGKNFRCMFLQWSEKFFVLSGSSSTNIHLCSMIKKG